MGFVEIWDKRPDFDEQHEEWKYDGPELKLEFSRISESRKSAPTLVIDDDNGTLCTVAYAISKRRNPDDAISDLRCREGTALKRIGYWFADGSRSGTLETPDSIQDWAAKKKFDVVIWTGLPSNFKTKKKTSFSVPGAIAHIQSLPRETKAMAAEYIYGVRQISLTRHFAKRLKPSRGSRPMLTLKNNGISNRNPFGATVARTKPGAAVAGEGMVGPSLW